MRRWLALAVVGLIGLAHLASYWWPFEDLFITLRYADNLASGAGLRFNPGETVDGFTSFSWVLIAALAELLELPSALALQLISAGCGLVLLALLMVELERRAGLSKPLVALVGLAMAASGTWAFWSATGMETSAFALLIAVAATTLARSPAALWPHAVLGAAALTRPEGIGYAAVILAVLALRDRRAALRAAVLFTLVFGPYFAWHWAHFGHPLPNTYYAKASASGALLGRGLIAVEEYLSSQMAWLPFAMAAWVLVRRWSEHWVRLYAAIALAALGNIAVVGGDVFNFHRFALPALLPLLVLFGRGLADFIDRSRLARPRLVAGAAAGGLALWLALATITTPVSLLGEAQLPPRQRAAESVDLFHDFRAVGRWLRDNVPDDTWIAVNAAGIVPYESQLPTIDMLGLSDSHIAHRDIALGEGLHGHEKYDAEYVLSREPTLILFGLPELLQRPPSNADELRRIVTRRFRELPGDRALIQHPRFRAMYAPTTVPIDDRWLVLFVRRDRLPALRAAVSGSKRP